MIGRTLSHFRIVDKIGEGGMGVVYRAEDERLRRPVALKVLPPELVADEERRLRFLREARAAAAVTHPNIATVYEVGEAEGQVFIAMELVEGKTLRDVIGGRAMPIKEALRVAVEVAEGLARAHQARVIHRDLKPDNVIVGSDGHSKILDFGLAKLVQKAGQPGGGTGAAAEARDRQGPGAELSSLRTISSEMTREGRIFGTAAYMSPEQVRGERLDARSDIFSFGVMLYEMITGKAPFRGRTGMDTMSAILQQEPAAPRSLNSDIQADLERVIFKCLRKDPGDRYQHADEVAVDLRDVRRATEPGARATAVVPAWPRRSLRGRLAWLSVAVVAAGLLGVALLAVLDVGGVRGLLRLGGAPGRIDSVAVLPLENLSGDAEQEYFADGMTDELISSLAKISALKVISRTSVMRYKGQRKALPQIAQELNVDAIVEGTVRRSGERVRITAQLIQARTDRHLWAESYERDLRDVLALQSEVARAIAHEIRAILTPQEQHRLARVRRVKPEAYEAYLKGRYYWNKRTEEGFRKAIGYFERAIEEDPGDARPYSGLADAYSMLGSYYLSSPTEAFPKARTAAMKALEIDDTLAEAHTSLAWVKLAYDWDWSGAESDFERAIELDPSYATAHQWYAYYHAAMGRVGEAVASARRAERLEPLSVNIIKTVGSMLRVAGEYHQAEEHLRKGIEMDPGFADAHTWLGWVLLRKGEHEEAIAEFQKALDLSGGSTEYLAALGTAYARSGERNRARKVIEDLMLLSKRRYVAAFHVASIYGELGENDLAFRWLEKAYEERGFGLFLINFDVDMGLDRLRSDPRFAGILRRVGLPTD